MPGAAIAIPARRRYDPACSRCAFARHEFRRQYIGPERLLGLSCLSDAARRHPWRSEHITAVQGRSPGRAESSAWPSFGREYTMRSSTNAYDRHSEVVQRRQGLWVHHARERPEGPVRPSFGHSGQGVQVPRRGRSRRVRRGTGSEGTGRRERREDLALRREPRAVVTPRPPSIGRAGRDASSTRNK